MRATRTSKSSNAGAPTTASSSICSAFPTARKSRPCAFPLPNPADARALKEKRRRGEVEGLVALPTAKYTVCISSQVGCALACAFCATGKLGFSRNLATWEMLAQVQAIAARGRPSRPRHPFPGHGRAAAQLRPRHGHGARALPSRRPGHLGRRHFHLYRGRRAGHPAFHRRESALSPHRFAGRAHARDALAAHAHRGALATCRAGRAVREYAAASKERVTLAYVGVSGVNMSRQAARELGQLFAGVRVKVNLIDGQRRQPVVPATQPRPR